MVKAVIFDFFGVLVGRGFEDTYQKAGGDPVRDRHFIEDLLGKANLGLISEEDFATAITRQIGVTPEAWSAALRSAEKPDNELLNYIEHLRGGYKTAILSNANHGVLEVKVGPGTLDRCFDEIVVSAEVGMVKPDPEIYRYAASRLGVSPGECIFVDDRDIHLAGAREAGMSTILYNNFAQTKADLEKLLAADSKS